MSSPTIAGEGNSINGEVVSYDGKAAVGYIVDVQGVSPQSSYEERGITDSRGHFEVSNLKPGEYIVVPYLEDVNSRYSAGASTFYTPHPVRFEVSPSSTMQHMTLRLGPPNRILTGTVTSSDTGNPVVAQIQIEFPNDPDRFVRFGTRADGTYRILIPASTQLAITVTAPGRSRLATTIPPVSVNSDPEINYRLAPVR